MLNQRDDVFTDHRLLLDLATFFRQPENMTFDEIQQEIDSLNLHHPSPQPLRIEDRVRDLRLQSLRRTHMGGYVNKHGVRVPNPCKEIDMQGRDLDRVGRNIRPGQKWDSQTIDSILSDPDNK